VFENPEETRRIVRRGLEVYAEHKWSSERKRFVDLVQALLRGNGQPRTKSEPGGYCPMEVKT